MINAGEDLLIEWTPAPPSDTPTVIAVEILVYDTDVVDPNGITMVARLVARGDDAAGELVIPAADLALLPLAPNRWSEWDEQEGYWGDMTIARHQLRRAKVQQGDAIVDFIHAINGPVTLESTDP